MKLVVYVMNKTSLLEEFLHELNENGVKGATILNSTGMGRKLVQNDDLDFIGSLKTLYLNPRMDSKVIFIVVKDEQVKTVYKVIDTVCDDLEKPHSGIVFTISIDNVQGYGTSIEEKK
jgi:nitrogen regulatory protein PII